MSAHQQDMQAPIPAAETHQKAAPTLVKTFRDPQRPSIAASVWLRVGNAGHLFLDYTLSRAWKPSEQEAVWNYSDRFFEGNGKALARVIDRAEHLIRRYHHDPEAALNAQAANVNSTGSLSG